MEKKKTGFLFLNIRRILFFSTGQMDSQQNLKYQVMENSHHQFLVHINE